MIPTSPFVKAGSLILSTTLLLGAAALSLPETEILTEGAGEAVEARVGTSFQDMATGILTAETIKDITTPSHPPDAAIPTETMDRIASRSPPVTPRTEVRDTPTATPDLSALAAPPLEAASSVMPRATDSPATLVGLTPHPPTEVAEANEDTSLPVSVPPQATPVLAPGSADLATELSVALVPVRPEPTPIISGLSALSANAAAIEPVTPVPAPATEMPVATPPDLIESDTADDVVPNRSVRPAPRDAKLAAKALAALSVPKATRKDHAEATRGNAQRNNTRGTATAASRTAVARTQGNTETASPQSGNAAASNYPGQVMSRIARVSKPRVRARGTAVIAFNVAASGGLAGVSVVRTSGSSALDQAALGVIRKAAPFPQPPAGAKRSFTINIAGS